MNDVFWFVAGLLTGVVSLLVAMPLWRASAGHRGTLFAVVGACAFAVLAVAIYRSTGRPELLTAPAATAAASSASDDENVHADSLEVSMQRLQARLARNGGSNEDWELLAKTYEFMGRPAEAAQARRHIAAAATAVSANAAVGTAAIVGTISLDSKLAGLISPGDTLFIYAKAADSPGPPLAVLRLPAGNWPVQFKLDDSQAMVPTRRLSGFSSVVVEARVSHSGQAMRTPGDLYGVSATIDPAGSKPLSLVISHVVS